MPIVAPLMAKQFTVIIVNFPPLECHVAVQLACGKIYSFHTRSRSVAGSDLSKDSVSDRLDLE